MRRLEPLAAAAALLMLPGCGGEGSPPAEPAAEVSPPPADPALNEARPKAENGRQVAAPSLEPPETPALAGMSPYRRREYERGWRDCLTDSYDRERQGESYRLGCMAAENAKAGEEP